MDDETKGSSPILRYWPVLIVAVVVAAVVLIGALGGDGDGAGDDVGADTSTTEPDDGEGQDPGAQGDAADAPDCDPETGRIMVPNVYAPDCVPLWPEGADNGGSTYQGVTADEIIVAFYDPELSAETVDAQDRTGITTPEEAEQIDNRLRVVGAYGDLFETYGRTVRVELVGASGPAEDESSARADAIRIAEEIGAFAVVGGPTATNAYADELADRGVVCLCTSSQPIDNYLDWSPYVWSGLMASTQGYVHRADFIANRLAGSPAQYAGDEAFQDTERTFGLVWYETADGAYQRGIDFFEERLADDGVELTVSLPYIAGGNTQEDAQAMITRLKAEGVTSVIFAGDPLMPQSLTAQATAQDYWPEWIVTGSSLTDNSRLARLYDQEQWANAFGLGFLLPPLDPDLEQREGNLVSWHLGEELSTYPNIYDWGRLFTGIHLAGPNLTPDTFRDGLFSFTPVSGFQTHFAVSYGEGTWEWDDYLGADDVTLLYWDPEAPDTRTADGEVGMYRYLDEARRYLPGEVGQTTTPFFEDEGTVTIFEARPDGDVPPQYPRRSGRDG